MRMDVKSITLTPEEMEAFYDICYTRREWECRYCKTLAEYEWKDCSHKPDCLAFVTYRRVRAWLDSCRDAKAAAQ